MNYLILRNDGIGDLIVSTCGISQLRMIDKKAYITLICSDRNREYAKILKKDGHIDRLYNLDDIKNFSQTLKFVSILIIFFFIPNLLVDKFNLAPGHPAENSTDILLNIFFEIITFNFVRLSELQELLFNLYLVSHAYYLFMNFKK